MRIEGTLSKWNDDRGFGFITPERGGEEIFVHISEFPKDGMRPKPGEKLSFEIEIDNAGRKRAKYLVCPQRPSPVRTRPPDRAASHRSGSGQGRLGRAIGLVIVLGLGFYAYNEFYQPTPPMPEPVTNRQAEQTSPVFRCDGRTHCSEMRSCAEARYFLLHCPNTLMDGDGDGIPCEEQWCSGLFPQ